MYKIMSVGVDVAMATVGQPAVNPIIRYDILRLQYTLVYTVLNSVASLFVIFGHHVNKRKQIRDGGPLRSYRMTSQNALTNG